MKSKGTMWPGGFALRFHRDLSSHLRNMAASHARSALNNFTSETYGQVVAAINIGCAVELMAKSFLVSREPALLLADRVDQDTLLYLTDNGGHAKKKATEIKTIGLRDALLLAQRFAPRLQFNWQSSDSLVCRVRDAAAHMALVDPRELRRAVVVMVRLLEDLLALDADSNRKNFWGADRLGLVDDMLAVVTADIRHVVAAKIIAARSRLAAMLQHLTEPDKLVALALRSGKPGVRESDHEEAHECPVCQQQGWLVCNVERGELQYEGDGDNGSYAVRVERTAYPNMFECVVCELVLNGLDGELNQFDFPKEIELEPDYDPYETNEPDEPDVDME